MLKKAMIMAAGVGSRLEPLSSVIPKPLVPLANTPTMDILVKHLKSFGIKDVIANTYYKAEYIQNHYKDNNFGMNFQFIKETELSGTAGGVKKCQFFFNEGEDFIVMSGDGLTDVDIEKAYFSHKESNSIATIITKEVEHKDVSKYGIIVTDKNGFVESFQEKPSINEAKSNLANTGIYIFNYTIFSFIPQNTFYDFAKNVFPAILSSGIKINTYTHTGYWSDIGSLEQYKESNRDIVNRKISSFYPQIIESINGKYVCGKDTKIGENTSFHGENIVGSNCTIGKNCKIINSILWDNIFIQNNLTIENSIILPNTTLNESIQDKILSSNDAVNSAKISV